MALLIANSAFCATAQLNAQITINGVPVSLTKDQNMSLKINKSGGKTVYVSTDLKTILPAKFRATQEPYATSATTVANSIVLTRQSGSTATLSLVCRATTTAYVATVTDGQDCATAISTVDGLVYITVYPTGATFVGDNSAGAYTGTVTVTTDYY